MDENSLLDKSALKVNSGIEQPPIVNPNAINQLKQNRQKQLGVDEYVEGIRSGNRTILSKAITLVESTLPEHHIMGQEIIEKCLPHSSSSIRIGITGVPGAGKSTFIESFGKLITGKGHKLAVLAIDPSSSRSKGSILGDKTRMETLTTDPNAFIRPSPSGGSLGGVARKTRESVILCEAAGFDVVFIETVGVGQSETAVHSMVDFFLLLMIAGAGDELQGIKRGIMEMADLLVINKADGSNVMKAQQARAEYQSAMQLFPPTESGWKPKALTISALEKMGLDEVWETIRNYIELTKGSGYFSIHRRQQSKYWLYESVNENLSDNFYHHPNVGKNLEQLERQVLEDKISSFAAARQLLNLYLNKSNS